MNNPLLPWLKDTRITGDTLAGDASAAVIVTLMLIPQSLAYALLAGLPAHIGLYASVLPLLGYALFGRSPALAVGPVAITSIMTYDALLPYATPGSPEWVSGAIFLALASGALLMLFGFLRFGFLAALLSHPVMSGFISGAAVLIIIGQLGTLSGIAASGSNAFEQLRHVAQHLHEINLLTLVIGLSTLALLLLARTKAQPFFLRLGLRGFWLNLVTKAAPLAAIAVITLVLVVTGLGAHTATVGSIPAGLPVVALPEMGSAFSALFISALLIAVVGFIESVSMARTVGRAREVPTDPDAELRGLGAANLLSGMSGAFPVTGGLARTVVNMDAGARTPLAGVFSALLMVIVLLGAAQFLSALPLASLAALIIVAIWSLIDLKTLRASLKFDRSDAAGWLVTFFGVLVLGVEQGVMLGIALSIGTVLWRQSRPHIAVIGRLPGTEHFRNVNRHEVDTLENVVFLRVDGNLFFANWDRVREFIDQQVASLGASAQVVLNLASVSDIDSTALEGIEALFKDLARRQMGLHLCEVKGPIADKLKRVELNQRVPTYLSTHQAYEALMDQGYRLRAAQS